MPLWFARYSIHDSQHIRDNSLESLPEDTQPALDGIKAYISTQVLIYYYA